MLRKFIILSIIVIFCSLALPGLYAEGDMERLLSLESPPVKEEPWVFDRFPIVAWWGPPGSSQPEDFENYKDAGFTLYAANPDTGYERSIKLAGDQGLKILSFRTTQGFGLPAKKVEYDEKDDRIVGWITHDEPGPPSDVIRSITETNELMRKHPSKRAFFNFLPPHAQPEPGTKKVVEIALKNGLPIISYDNYNMIDDGTTRERQHFRNLELFRSLSLEHDAPLWAFALTIKHAYYRRPSESDIRWKQFTNLAYGAKGLWYFTYWGPTNWDRWDNKAIIDPKDGSKTEIYDYVSKINYAVLGAEETLLNMTSVDVVHTSPTVECRPFTGDRWISDIRAKKAMIGYFRDEKGSDYALVVNCLHGPGKTAAETADEIDLRFAPDVKTVEAIMWLDGETGPLPLKNGRVILNITGGTGVLLKPVSHPGKY